MNHSCDGQDYGTTKILKYRYIISIILLCYSTDLFIPRSLFCYDERVQLLFLHTDKLESLEILLATNAYEAIWQTDGLSIVERFSHYTGLRFQQKEIQVLIHDYQSMSGKDGVPMRLSVKNNTIIKKRNALVHELAHRLLFGHGLYAPDDTNPADNDEIRVLLFQGDVIEDLYGYSDYSYWATIEPSQHSEDHLKDLRYVLSISKMERLKIFRDLIEKQ